MVWAAAGRPAGILPRLLCDGAEPGWLAAGLTNVLSNAAVLDCVVAAAAAAA